jgi:hypothetical protein
MYNLLVLVRVLAPHTDLHNLTHETICQFLPPALYSTPAPRLRESHIEQGVPP